MTPEEAIEIKQHYQYVLPKESYPELIEADNLSIEALKLVKQLQGLPGRSESFRLPGETKGKPLHALGFNTGDDESP